MPASFTGTMRRSHATPTGPAKSSKKLDITFSNRYAVINFNNSLPIVLANHNI